MTGTQYESLKEHLTSLDANELRKASDILRNAFSPKIRISPMYPRDNNRPGWIVFFTVFDKLEDPNAPKITQLELTRGTI